MLGYSPEITLETGLKHVVDWYRNIANSTDGIS
jgi:dTDP-D-glucose 4,6-dehydratase